MKYLRRVIAQLKRYKEPKFKDKPPSRFKTDQMDPLDFGNKHGLSDAYDNSGQLYFYVDEEDATDEMVKDVNRLGYDIQDSYDGEGYVIYTGEFFKEERHPEMTDEEWESEELSSMEYSPLLFKQT